MIAGPGSRRWTLRRRLVTGTILLVLAAMLCSGIATVVTLRTSLLERLDAEVLVGVGIVAGPDRIASDESAESGPSDAPVLSDTAPSDAGPRQRINTLEVEFDSAGTVTRSAYVRSDGTTVTLTETQLGVIRSVLDASATPVTVDLGGALGSFRIASAATTSGTAVSGLSLNDLGATLSSLTVILGIVTAIALALAGVGIGWLVTRSLRPLRRVADTAEQVSQRTLAAGAVTLPERAALTEDPGTEVGRVGVALDTLLNHVESALTSRQESEDRLRAFVADASHELRTPLASIRGYAQLAQSDAGATESEVLERALLRIASEADRMGALVEDLLLLARLDSGQSLCSEPVDLALLAFESVTDAHVTAPDHEWVVEVDASMEVSGDPHQLRQVVINLLANAAAHTPPGTRVTVSIAEASDHAVLTVSDTGPGIDAALLPRLFDRFARGDASRNRNSGGSGLGLSIAAAIVAAHDGTLEVFTGSDSRDGVGATFVVRVPLMRSEQENAAG